MQAGTIPDGSFNWPFCAFNLLKLEECIVQKIGQPWNNLDLDIAAILDCFRAQVGVRVLVGEAHASEEQCMEAFRRIRN